MTSSKEEYLYKLADLSDNSHTASYVADVIGEIIENIGPSKISAIVSDNVMNVQNTRIIL